MNYYLEVLKKYAVFNGRARREEYWMFFLFNTIISLIFLLIDIIISNNVNVSFIYGIGIFSILYSMAVLIPGIAVAIRRLHDTNHSGWWCFINLIPLVGAIIFTILMVRDSQIGENKYGLNPKKTNNLKNKNSEVDKIEKLDNQKITKHWWHRLYKVVLWLGSIFIGFFSAIELYDFDEIIFTFIFFSIVTFLSIFLIYRFILYIILGTQIFINKKEKKYFIIGIIIVCLIFVAARIYFDYKDNQSNSSHSKDLDLDLDLPPLPELPPLPNPGPGYIPIKKGN